MYFSLTTKSRYHEALVASYKAANNWPADAVKVDDETSERLYAALVAGDDIQSDGAGGFVITPKPGATLEQLKDAAIKVVDSVSDAARESLVGNPLRSVEYQITAAEAQAYKDAGYTGSLPRSVAIWAAVKGISGQAAADSILSKAAAWNQVLYDVRDARLRAKDAIRAASDAAAIEATVSELRVDLAAMAADNPVDL